MSIEHVAIWVHDLERMRSFYETYFGATANSRYMNTQKKFASYFLSFPHGGPRLEIMQMPGIREAPKDGPSQWMGYAHVACSVGSETAVDTLTNQLRTDGYTIVDGPRRTGDGYYESVVLDPEQNRIEVTI
ncbi:VOC family protein [Spirosoma validum]|uniref:VOC family protein n=1 Tax=Spirosoma validum TaxID=2771355 RepID=A0A927AZT6_9BACT|nr:VOC family protein [Spirosoma validum]MBD2752672.1 VOC family protein [Spirosoma validum]